MNYIKNIIADVMVSVLTAAVVLYILQHYFNFKFDNNTKFTIALIVVVSSVGIGAGKHNLKKQLVISFLSSLLAVIVVALLYKYFF